MPPRKRFLTRSKREWSDEHLMQLRSGHDFFGEAWGGYDGCDQSALSYRTLSDVPTDVAAEMADCWAEHGADLMAQEAAERPGRRCWFQWVHELLPADPRRRVSDLFPVDASLCPPWGDADESRDGFESSLDYLRRRGLLLPGEANRLAAGEVRRAGA